MKGAYEGDGAGREEADEALVLLSKMAARACVDSEDDRDREQAIATIRRALSARSTPAQQKEDEK